MYFSRENRENLSAFGAKPIIFVYRVSSLEVIVFHLVVAFDRSFIKSFYTMINMY